MGAGVRFGAEGKRVWMCIVKDRDGSEMEHHNRLGTSNSLSTSSISKYYPSL